MAAFSFLAARLRAPDKEVSSDLRLGDSYLGRYYCVLMASIAFGKKDEDIGVFNW
jgi:hypothetical protein